MYMNVLLLIVFCCSVYILFVFKNTKFGIPPLPSDSLILGIDAQLRSLHRFWEKNITTCPCRVIPVTMKGYSGDFDELKDRSSSFCTFNSKQFLFD